MKNMKKIGSDEIFYFFLGLLMKNMENSGTDEIY